MSFLKSMNLLKTMSWGFVFISINKLVSILLDINHFSNRKDHKSTIIMIFLVVHQIEVTSPHLLYWISNNRNSAAVIICFRILT